MKNKNAIVLTAVIVGIFLMMPFGDDVAVGKYSYSLGDKKVIGKYPGPTLAKEGEACVYNKDCMRDVYVGDFYCMKNRVYKNIKDNYCDSSTKTCKSVIDPRLINTCGFFKKCDIPTATCRLK